MNQPDADQRLPNWQKAIIDRRKLVAYCLDPLHPEGGDKAHLFERLLGITSANHEILLVALEVAISTQPSIQKQHNMYGSRFEVRFWMEHNNRSILVVSGWIVRVNEDFPRLTTCYIV